MSLHIVGTTQFDEARLSAEIVTIARLPFNNAYAQYAVGFWKTCVLANQSGKASDSHSEEYKGSARETEHGIALPYLMEQVNAIFKREHIKSIRLFACAPHGMIVPHRDYLEFREGFTRLHLPIQTGPGCFNSEEDRVYEMKKGEIWFLDGRMTHSAGNFSALTKLAVVVDFDPKIGHADLFRDPQQYQAKQPVEFSDRPALNDERLRQINEFSHWMAPWNFDAIIGLLAKVHFFHRVDSARTWDWLEAICLKANQPALAKKARELRREFIG